MLRNSLLPTIAVVATQVGYLIGGLLVIEKLFNYNGIGQRIYTAAQNKDFPMLQSGVLIVGIVYLVATFVADILYSRVQSAHPLRSCGMSATTTPDRSPSRRPAEARIWRGARRCGQLAPLEDIPRRRCARRMVWVFWARHRVSASRRTTRWSRPTRCC